MDLPIVAGGQPEQKKEALTEESKERAITERRPPQYPTPPPPRPPRLQLRQLNANVAPKAGLGSRRSSSTRAHSKKGTQAPPNGKNKGKTKGNIVR